MTYQNKNPQYYTVKLKRKCMVDRNQYENVEKSDGERTFCGRCSKVDLNSAGNDVHAGTGFLIL